jgi:uncharacterized protein
MTAEERSALAAFVTAVRHHYGPRLVDMFVFGSRARGDATEDSDVDLAIILTDGDWTFWPEKTRLIDMSFDAYMDAGLVIQAWPIARSAWENPDQHHNPRLIRAARRDAKPVHEAA